tara:strand:- start:17890 stop:18615 length:726 start_codon:yes stop_codon:yes gene_type:complete
MKVAILIPGLVRTYKQTYDNFLLNVIEPNKDEHEIDLFLAFWDHTHERGEAGKKDNIKQLEEEERQSILSLYSPKDYLIMDDYFHKNNQEFFEITEKLVKSIGTPKHPDGNKLIQNAVVAQYYSWYKCYSLIKEDYDIIVKTRFDITTEKIYFNDFRENLFNCAGPPHQYPQYKLSDVFFASNQKNMKAIMDGMYCDILNDKLANISKLYPNVFPEYILKDLLKKQKIKVNYLDKKVCIIR